MKKLITFLCASMSVFTITHGQTALDFDGTDDQIVVGNQMTTDITGNNTLTVEAWVKTSTTTGLGVIVGNYNYPTNNGQMQFLLRRDNDSYAFWIDDGDANGNDPVYTGAGTVVTGQWQHVAGVWDGTETRIYLDGVLMATTTTLTGPGFPSITNEVVLGTNVFNEVFTGQIDNVRIWSSVRSEADIAATKNQCLSGSESGLLALYTFEDGTGSSVLTDETLNGYDGALTNMDPATDWIASAGGPQSVVDQSLSLASATICPNSSTTVDLSFSQENMLYYLRDNSDNSFVSGPVTGTGTSGISLSTGDLSATTTFNVFASNQNVTALNFDGVDDIVDCGTALTNDLDGQTSITVEAWVKSTTISTSGVIVGNYNYPNNNNDMQFLLRRDADSYAFFINDGNGYVGLSSGVATAVAGVWQHVVGTWDGTTTRIYVDGVELNSNSSLNGPGFPSLPNNNVVIGDNVLNEQFSGDIDKVRIWSNARTIDEINEASSACLTGSETGLLALYGMENGQNSSTLTDQTGNGYDGTLTNMDPSSDWVQGVECSTCGNQMSTTVTVTVEDITAPVLADVPTNISAVANAANCEATVTWTAPTATDNCTASPVIASTHSSGDAFPLGTTTVSYTATDDEGNVTTETFDVTVTSDLTSAAAVTSSYNGADVSCNGATDGEATVTPTAGTSPYTYLWSDGQTTAVATGLAAGTYDVDVIDANGCTATTSATVTEPTALDGTATATAETNGNDGSIDLTPAGGTSPYTYAWTGPNGFTSTDQNPTGLEGGAYEVTITDDNGCTFVVQVTVDSFVGLVNNESNDFMVYPNPSNGKFTIESASAGVVEIMSMNGKIVYSTTTESGKTKLSVPGLAHGVYTLRLTSGNSSQLKKLVIR